MCYKEEKWEIGFFLFFFFLIKVARPPPRPQSAGRPRAPFLPRKARRLRLRFPQLTWAIRPRPHVTRFPDAATAPPTLPGSFSPRRGPAQNPAAACAHAPPEPGSAATSGPEVPRTAASLPQAGANLGPGLAARGGRAANRSPPFPQTGAATHRDAGAPVPAASGPRRPGCTPEHSRPAPLPEDSGAAAAAALRGGNRLLPCPPLPPPPRPSPGRGDNGSAAPRRRQTSVC